MRRILSLRPWPAYAIYVLLDLLCGALGMGVPVLCIALGFLVGWYVTRAASERSDEVEHISGRALPAAFATAGFTFAMMVGLWGPLLAILSEPGADYVNVGIPLILFEPKASFIGWEVLMIVLSPALQVLTTVFAAHVTLRCWLRRRDTGPAGGDREH